MITVLLLALSMPPAHGDRPNVVFIMADDLGYGDLGCYGQESIATPHLDRLAAEGTLFTEAYAGSTVCAPSRCVLMTGKHTGHAFMRGNRRLPLPAEEVTLAEILSGNGYRTTLIGKWGLGNPGTEGEPTRQGFDSYYGYADRGHAHNYYPEFLIRDGECVPLDNVVPDAYPSGAGKATEKRTYSHDLFMEEAIAFVDENHEEPFFLYLPLTIPHANNEAGNEGMEVPELGAYAGEAWPAPQRGTAAMITRMDAGIGRLLDRLEDHGVADQTIVIFTSDNGPHREGGNDPDFFDSNGPLRGIKRSMHDGGIRVPLIVKWPGQVAAGARVDGAWGFVDMVPTFCDVLGVEAPPGQDGISVLPLWRGQAQPELDERLHYWEFHERGFRQAARQGRWKAVRDTGSGGPLQLYDLQVDIGEMNDVAADHPEIAAALADYLDTARVPSEYWRTPAEKEALRREREESVD